VDLYAGKTAMLGRLEPLVEWLIRAGVSADTLTLAALPVAALAALCLALSPSLAVLLIAIPLLAGLRLLLNLLDGAVARRTESSHPRGELLNELGDRLADVGFLAPVALLPGASPTIVLLGVIVGILAKHAGITSRAAGGERIYRGILSKPGRMMLLSVASIGSLVVGDVAWTWFGPLLLLGTSLTLLERIAIAVRRLP
jgi:CDP-diacylglycerol--glycerol-3-phosphate 3-phosphatidyltransferase